jgi:hypothetical protein
MKIVEIRTTVVGAPWRDLTFVELLTDTASPASARFGCGEPSAPIAS